MSDGFEKDWLDDELRSSLQANDPAAPPFQQTFAAAEAAAERQRARRRMGAGIAALAAAVVIGIAVRPATPTDEFAIQEALLTGTQWRAPSDTLLPSHSVDIYQETRWTVADWPSSTIFEEGTLL